MIETHVLLVVLLAAALHATWNALVKGASDKLIAAGGKIREVEAPVDLEELISKYIFGKV